MPTEIVDLGTGSGNIIISIIKNISKKIKRINFYAVDISKEALIVAKENAKKHRVEKKIKFIQSDALEYFFKNKIKLKNVFIVANLPYVSHKIYDKNKNNLKYEPKEAILSLENGLAHYKKLFKQVESLSADKYLLFIEINAGQKLQIARISRKYMPKSNVFFSKDLAGKWRIVKIEITR
jgi:release factor glutamine methyltransferase